jgi:hypothetical protein
MSKLKTMMAAAALSTALSGGVVGLGAAVTNTTANAATTASAANSVTSAPVLARWCRWHRHGGWGHHGWGHGWGGHGWGGHGLWGHHGWGGHRWGHHGRYINRVKVRLDLHENRVRFTHRRGCLNIHHGSNW